VQKVIKIMEASVKQDIYLKKENPGTSKGINREKIGRILQVQVHCRDMFSGINLLLEKELLLLKEGLNYRFNFMGKTFI
jgi:hypothetical protein